MRALLEVQGVTKRFGGLVAVDNVSLTLRRGEVVGLIGPNGAGKTSLFNVICGVERPDEGSVTLHGERIDGLRPDQICRRALARTFQVTQPFGELTALENVMVGALSRTNNMAVARARALECLEFVGLREVWRVPGHGLSTGQRKRLEVARALATQPVIMLLDEVVGGVDMAATRQLIDLIARLNHEGMTMLVIEHRLEVIGDICQRVICLDLGRKIADGPPSAVLSDPTVMRAYLGGSHAAS